MRTRSTLTALFFAVFALIIGATVVPHALPSAKADSDRKLTQREWKKLMKSWARGLGVKCGYCHVPEGEDDFDFEAKTPNKHAAHECEEQFVERLSLRGSKVTCVDCHNGKAKFLPKRGSGPQGKLTAD